MRTVTLKLIGTSPMLLHSDRGANPIAPETVAHKALTSKRKKTDEDHIAIARSEYMLGFYPGNDVVIPTTNVKSAIVEGAKLNKLGSAFNRVVMILDDVARIQHSGPNGKDRMWGTPACVDARSVKVGTARLMRYRPRLNDWSLTVDVVFDEKMIEQAQIVTAAENAGRYIGIGDYRPARGGAFGRFNVEVKA
ncbi:MAG: hypothetical protein RL456_2744 [Pseudomonadota bacterium]|jgi:hypothetical protein